MRCCAEGGPYAYGSRVCLRLWCQREDRLRQSQRCDVTRLLASRVSRAAAFFWCAVTCSVAFPVWLSRSMSQQPSLPSVLPSVPALQDGAFADMFGIMASA